MAKTKQKLVVFTGAGVSAESGISTFRDDGGLWEKHRIEDVATPEAFAVDPERVLRFYNARWKNLNNVKPNAAHETIAKLEADFDVAVVTQNVDNLHERAGSTRVVHLHGRLDKCRSNADPTHLYDMPPRGLTTADRCPFGHALRPHIVWFGEAVPEMDTAMDLVRKADIMLVVGTSLAVYPAAGLVEMAPPGTAVYLVDPGDFARLPDGVVHLKEKASVGTARVAELLRQRL